MNKLGQGMSVFEMLLGGRGVQWLARVEIYWWEEERLQEL
jgi:hypothetical protein